ncbi:unnamed protein product, partial [Arabidopsis halleri]
QALDRGEKIELLVDKIREPLFTGTRFQSARNENDKKDVENTFRETLPGIWDKDCCDNPFWRVL